MTQNTHQTAIYSELSNLYGFLTKLDIMKIDIFNIKKMAVFLLMGGAMVSTTHAGLITSLDFNDLNPFLGATNTLNVGGSTTGVAVLGTAGNNYSYGVTYTNQDFDGDTINDTLTFNVLVEGWSGGTVGTDSATIGTTDAAVTDRTSVTAGRQLWTVGGNMAGGESLQFTLQNFVVTTTLAGTSGSASSLGFDQVTNLEWQKDASTGHQAVYGVGTGLQSGNWGNPERTDTFATSLDPLNISSFNSGGNGYDRWGTGEVDFGIQVDVVAAVPEPSSALLLVTILGLSAVFYRPRRKHNQFTACTPSNPGAASGFNFVLE